MIEEEAVRRARLERLRQAGIDPYPASVERTHTVEQFLGEFETFAQNTTVVVLCGRVKTKRKHGGLTFCHIEDASGTIQVAFKRDHLGEEAYTFLHETIDSGDFMELRGTAFTTKAGEKSLDVTAYRIITKSLLPLPEKWHGLTDTETRYRQRELDLIANPHVRNIFRVRATILRTMRNYLDRHGCLEVETPILQIVPGGASAKPFKTYHNALDTEMYLRIAPELYLKRCVVGGLERVYEVARCFRNEGIDHAHNPEFTQVEGYLAYMDYGQLMDFLEDMMIEVIQACGLDITAVPYQGHKLNFSKPWKRTTFRDAVLAHAGVDIETLTTRELAAKTAIKLSVPVEKTDSLMTILDNIYKNHVRPKIIQPTYLMDHPAEMTPLAKRKPENPRYVEMFQLVYGGGVENIKAFSELNDPIDQEARFAEQEAARANGDEEAQFGDAEYVRALKHGLPPTAGFGIGIDRLAATLTDAHNLKEVILFPTLRPETRAPESVASARAPEPARATDVLGTIKKLFEDKGIEFLLKHHGPRPEDSDEALGFDPSKRPHHQGAKAIIVKGKKSKKFFHIVLPDDCRIDQKKAAKVIGEAFSFASPDEVVEQTGCVPGSVPPLGSVLGLQTHVDIRLKENEDIFFNAGSLTDSIRMKLEDYLKVEPCIEVDVAE